LNSSPRSNRWPELLLQFVRLSLFALLASVSGPGNIGVVPVR
jgi:hypothetical protein